MSESKAAFRRRLGRLLNTFTPSITNGVGSTTSFIATELTDYYTSDGMLSGAYIYDVTAAEWRTIDNWTASSGTGTVLRAFTTSQSSGRSIEIYEQFSPKILDDALRMALDEAYAYIVIDIRDDSIVVENDVYEYPIPENFRDFSRMAGSRITYSIDENIETYPRTELMDWHVITNGSDLTLALPVISGIIGKTLQLHGKGVPTYPSTDGSLLPFRSDTLQLLAYKAAEIVWRTGPGLSGKDAEYASLQEAKWAAKFEERKDEWGTPLIPAQMQDPNFGPMRGPMRDAPLAYYHRNPS